jgi:phospholipid-binding lipoprotein MlaA
MRFGMSIAVVVGILFIIPATNPGASTTVAWAEGWFYAGHETRGSVADRPTPRGIEMARVTVDAVPLPVEEEYEEEEEVLEIADPIYYWNVAMYHFNDKLYFWVLKPVARGYRWAVPEVARTGVKNFFHNLGFPIRFVNCLLQAKVDAAVGEFGRFFVNTTVGVLGLGNPAKNCSGLTPHEEDFGQTLGVWCIGNGFYVVWPFLGPSTLRDSVGFLGDISLDPVWYVKPLEASIAIMAYDAVNETSFEIGDYESLKEAAIDPYVAIRDAYVQNRQKKLEE